MPHSWALTPCPSPPPPAAPHPSSPQPPPRSPPRGRDPPGVAAAVVATGPPPPPPFQPLARRGLARASVRTHSRCHGGPTAPKRTGGGRRKPRGRRVWGICILYAGGGGGGVGWLAGWRLAALADAGPPAAAGTRPTCPRRCAAPAVDWAGIRVLVGAGGCMSRQARCERWRQPRRGSDGGQPIRVWLAGQRGRRPVHLPHVVTIRTRGWQLQPRDETEQRVDSCATPELHEQGPNSLAREKALESRLGHVANVISISSCSN